MIVKIIFKIPLILTIFLIGQISYASLYYIVMRGDTLSGIASSHYPEMRIYGTEGSLEKLLKFNPEIKNPDLIFVGQKINLSEVISEQSRIKEEEANLAPKNEEREDYILDKDESGVFDLSLGVGAYYYSHSQSGVLGSANVGALF